MRRTKRLTLYTDRIAVKLPERPVPSDLDPDAFGIICRNLVENALRHGSPGGQVEVVLTDDGTFSVSNDGPTVASETLSRLTERFERGPSMGAGSGLGLAIVSGIAHRIASRLVLRSPRPGRGTGFQASMRLPVASF
jgi:two-component system OmpR family sensor kinase